MLPLSPQSVKLDKAFYLDYTIINFEDYPDIFPNLSQVLHLNDTWYVSTITFNENCIGSSAAEWQTYNINTGKLYGGIIEWELSRDGNLYINYD